MSDMSLSSSIPSGEITDYVKAFERLTEVAQRVQTRELDGGTVQTPDPVEREESSEQESVSEVELEPVELEPVEPELEETEEGEEEDDDVEFVPVASDVLIWNCRKVGDRNPQW